MDTGIFVLKDDGNLVELGEQSYDSESLLQELIAKYPGLLVGNQIDSTTPRRWLLITREAGLPNEADGSNRWSVDHLFLDQDAIPTLVEVKRSSDTRIRREVIGQLLDYAANAILYWPIETIRSRFNSRCQLEGIEPAQVIADFLGADSDVEQFWLNTETNLQAGKIRLIFVADKISIELQRVVEFLNSQMDPAEVLAVEIRQYVGKGLKTLVPRVIGQTADAQRRKFASYSENRRWDESSFFAELEQKCGSDAVRSAKRILEWANQQAEVWWGKGKRMGSFVPYINHKGRDHQLFSVWTYGTVEVYFYWYTYKPPFDSEDKRKELLVRLNSISGVSLPDESINKRPGIPISVFADEGSLNKYFEVFDWFIKEVRSI